MSNELASTAGAIFAGMVNSGQVILRTPPGQPTLDKATGDQAVNQAIEASVAVAREIHRKAEAPQLRPQSTEANKPMNPKAPAPEPERAPQGWDRAETSTEDDVPNQPIHRPLAVVKKKAVAIKRD